MVVLLGAILLASLLGSTHCVGMCGPLALWASGTTDQPRSRVALNTTLYHLGRLMAYLLMGWMAGLIGELVDLGGQTMGLRMMAARIVGCLMIAMGLWRLVALFAARLTWRRGKTHPSALEPSLVTRLLVKIRPWIFELPLGGRALATGIATAFLPCGWLYLFAFIAAGTAHPISGSLVMAAFWIGTVPLLTGLVVSASLIHAKFRVMVPVVASVLLVTAGVYTASGNGFASPDALVNLQETASKTEIKNLAEATLPCCQDGEKECRVP